MSSDEFPWVPSSSIGSNEFRWVPLKSIGSIWTVQMSSDEFLWVPLSSLDYFYLQTKPAHGPKLKTKLQNVFDHIRTLIGPNLFGIFITVWKFQIFSVIQIFRAINFGAYRVQSKNAVFAILEALNFAKLVNCSLPKVNINYKSEFRACNCVEICTFCTSSFSKFDFT